VLAVLHWASPVWVNGGRQRGFILLQAEILLT
jgi:hypothetical protein